VISAFFYQILRKNGKKKLKAGRVLEQDGQIKAIQACKEDS
jgi:hypothetical protein